MALACDVVVPICSYCLAAAAIWPGLSSGNSSGKYSEIVPVKVWSTNISPSTVFVTARRCFCGNQSINTPLATCMEAERTVLTFPCFKDSVILRTINVPSTTGTHMNVP